MSRRDSRVHISLHQNDSLQDFESFKKKFLFANKQITKQNCNLSLKIEELNAHISTLYVENLRLRASEIALQAQLRREKEKCQRIVSDAEAATMDLLKRFGIIRESYNVPMQTQNSQSPEGSPPQQPLCQKPPPRSPSAMRLAQLPTVPDIAEDTEPPSSTHEDAPPYNIKSYIPSSLSRKPRNTTSRSSELTTLYPAADGMDMQQLDQQALSRKRKLVRRPSGLMPTPDYGRPASPVLSSTVQRACNMSEEDEAAALEQMEVISARGSLRQEDQEQESTRKVKKRSSKIREESGIEHDARQENHTDKESEREKEREKDKDKKERKKSSKDRDSSRLKDVTNSPRRRRVASSATDMDVDNDLGEIERVSPIEQIEATSRRAKAILSKLNVDDNNELDGATLVPNSTAGLAAKAKEMAMEIEARSEDDQARGRGQQGRQAYLPTPTPTSRTSTPASIRDSLVLPPMASVAVNGVDQSELGGRERRTRKSVNYAEPKLNTKMRRPDPIPDQAMVGQRPSLSLLPVSEAPQAPVGAPRFHPEKDDEPTISAVPPPPSMKKKQARSSSSAAVGAPAAKRKRLPMPENADNEKDNDNLKGKNKSERGLGLEFGATTEGDDLTMGHRSEVEEEVEDDDDDGGDADGEFSDFRSTGGAGKWANVVTRSRRGEHTGSSSTARSGRASAAAASSSALTAAGGGTRRASSSVRDSGDSTGLVGLRRHSLAV